MTTGNVFLYINNSKLMIDLLISVKKGHLTNSHKKLHDHWLNLLIIIQ